MKIFEHGGNIYSVDGQAENFLDMSANINPFGLSESVKAAIINNIDGLIHYPDPSACELKTAIASRYRINFENIIVLNGAAEFFYLFFNVIRPKKVLIVAPSFSEYERSALAANCEIKFFLTSDQDNFNINFDKLTASLKSEKFNCIVLASPNNPTGNLIAAENILKLQSLVDYVMLDESFIDFIGDEKSDRYLVNDMKNLIVVQSLTKFFALPGLRLGFAIAEESLIKKFELAKDVWNVNYLAQKAGVTALNDNEYICKSRSWIAEEKFYIIDRLKKISRIKFFKPTVNFVLLKFESDQIAMNLIENFREKKILLRSCKNFRGLDGRFIRMAIRSRIENERVLNLIENFGGD